MLAASLSLSLYSFNIKCSPQTLDVQHMDEARFSRRSVFTTAQKLSERDPDDYELLWRLARAKHQLAMLPETSASERATLLKSAAHDMAKAKIYVRSDGGLYRWYGIILSDLTALQGNKEAIASAYEIRDCFTQALSLNPSDASAQHLLGRWCLTIATMNSWSRWFAGMLYAEPPKSSLEEALSCFERAEELSPGFWVANGYHLAKTLSLMGKKDLASKWAVSTLRLPILTQDDKENHNLTFELLSSLDPKAAGEFGRAK